MIQKMHTGVELGILKRKWQVHEDVWASSGYQGCLTQLIDGSTWFHKAERSIWNLKISAHSVMQLLTVSIREVAINIKGWK